MTTATEPTPPLSKAAEALRIHQNILFLLAEGSFPGKYAQGVHESLQFVGEMIVTLEKDVKNEQPAEETKPGVRRKTSPRRVDSGPVRD